MVGWKMSYLHLYSLEIPHFSIITLIHLMLKSVHLTRITRRSSHDHKRRWLNKVIHQSFSQCYVTQGLLQYISDNFSIGRADKMPEPRDSVTSQAAFKSFFSSPFTGKNTFTGFPTKGGILFKYIYPDMNLYESIPPQKANQSQPCKYPIGKCRKEWLAVAKVNVTIHLLFSTPVKAPHLCKYQDMCLSAHWFTGQDVMEIRLPLLCPLF